MNGKCDQADWQATVLLKIPQAKQVLCHKVPNVNLNRLSQSQVHSNDLQNHTDA